MGRGKIRQLLSTDEVVRNLTKIVGTDRVSSDEIDRSVLEHDIAPAPKELEILIKMTPDVIVRPRDVEDVAEIMKFAHDYDIPVTPRGSASWGLGGAVPTMGGILLDLRGMNRIIELDTENLVATVEPGVTWKELEIAVSDAGHTIATYPSSFPVATVGGWVSTGGVGIGSYKYGGVENQIRSLEVVLSDGSIIETGFKKVVGNGAGYRLNNLFTGAEGTLGIVTKIALKIQPKPEQILPISYRFSNFTDAVAVIKSVTRSNVVPYHIEFMDGSHVERYDSISVRIPKKGTVVHIVLEGTKDSVACEAKVIDKIGMANKGHKLPQKDSKAIWDDRANLLGVKEKGKRIVITDVFIPVGKLSEVIDRYYDLITTFKLKAGITGTIADRNTVVFMPYYFVDMRKRVKTLASLGFVKKLAELSYDVGGRPGGLGLWFTQHAAKMYGNEGVQVMRNIKRSLDPNNIVNPGKLTETGTVLGVPIPGVALDTGLELMALLKRLLPKD